MPRGRKEHKDDENSVSKALSVAIGLVTSTQERARQILAELEERGIIRRKDGRQFLKELAKKGQREREELQKTIDERILEVGRQMGIVTKRDLERITKKLEKLEARLR